MASLIRVILGVAVLVGAFVLRQKGEEAASAGTEAGGTVLLWGREVAPSSLNLLVIAFALIGVAMIVLGIVGLIQKKA